MLDANGLEKKVWSLITTIALARGIETNFAAGTVFVLRFDAIVGVSGFRREWYFIT